MLHNIGDILTLTGKTQRGKNRIDRSGSDKFEVIQHGQWGMFVWGLGDGRIEAFWIAEFNDPHMEVISNA